MANYIKREEKGKSGKNKAGGKIRMNRQKNNIKEEKKIKVKNRLKKGRTKAKFVSPSRPLHSASDEQDINSR